MRALTLTQPWATLVAVGAKERETRSWSTPYRGPLAIHAAKNFPRDARRLCIPGPGVGSSRQRDPFWHALRDAGIHGPTADAPYGRRTRWRYSTGDLPLGMVIAVVTLVDVRPTGPWVEGLSEQERAFGDYSTGRYVWELADVRRLPDPIEATGALGLWEWDGDPGIPVEAAPDDPAEAERGRLF